MASIAEEMKEIREYDKANGLEGLDMIDRIKALNTKYDDWVFTPNAHYDKIHALKTNALFIPTKWIEV